ncbi:hypothetical protein D3C81_1062540 [compost metagenome]
MRTPGFAQAHRAGWQPGGVRRVDRRFRLDQQRDARRGHADLLAHWRAERLVGFVAVLGDLGGAEGLSGNVQDAALLREDGVARFDHAVAHAVDLLLVGARLAELFDPGIGDLQRGQTAVVVQRYRVIDAQGENHLCLHIDFRLVDAGVDEYRRQLAFAVGLLGFQYLQADRLRAAAVQVDRRNDHDAALFRLQGDDPAGGGASLAAEGGEAVDLARAEYREVLFERRDVGFAEYGGVVRLQGQVDAFPLGEARAVDAGGERRVCRDAGQHEQDRDYRPFHHCGFSWRCCCWYQNLRRSSSDGLSGICRSHCSRAWRRSSLSRPAGVGAAGLSLGCASTVWLVEGLFALACAMFCAAGEGRLSCSCACCSSACISPGMAGRVSPLSPVCWASGRAWAFSPLSPDSWRWRRRSCRSALLFSAGCSSGACSSAWS